MTVSGGVDRGGPVCAAVLLVAAAFLASLQPAHARLAKTAFDRGDFKTAKTHCDAVDAGLAATNAGLIGAEQFRWMEAYATYRASGNDAGELVKMLDDPRPLRRLMGVRLLTSYGTREHLPKLRAMLADASPQLRSAVQRALATIRARSVSTLPRRGPTSERQLRKALAASGKVLWVRRDPFRRSTRWVVWVGTDQGLFAWDRSARSWSAYSVGLKHLGVPVLKLATERGRLVVTVRLARGAATYRFDPVARTWTEVRSRP